MIDTLPVHHHTRVISILRNGEIVAFPTGTTYGFGVNALSQEALQKLIALKGRGSEKAFSMVLPEKNRDEFVELSEKEKDVLTRLSDKPLTLLVKPKQPLNHLAKDGLVGVRTADHPFTKTLAELLDFPFTATSANHTGENPAYSVDDLMKMFKNDSFMAVDGGVLPNKKPSTVAKYMNGAWEILREGDVRKKDLEGSDQK